MYIAVKPHFCQKVFQIPPEKQISKGRADVFRIKRSRFLCATCMEIITCHPNIEVAAGFSRNFNEAM
ncbi:hypothetical protein [Methanosarcina sp. WWM596]|uniref:hypothetical protein n=1 Tax=Methanosarcina sp. WWM596 TaxID=1434103 RepID=UPI0006160032|nr:hypothetical protein [Methanosarcina sp. WWM596]AKB19644.1 hypothetical protein MSWHS_2781 [Methanosarcina sp. WWM596]AKB22565.1 hypothetical protein MSWH1_2294 [Methanosarcina sp. WH1]